MKLQHSMPRRTLILGSLLFSLGLSTAWAEEMPRPPNNKHEHMQERCKADPQKCEEMKKRHEAQREACKQDPQACKQKREEMREKRRAQCEKEPEACKQQREALRQKMEERCKAEPQKCEEWKKDHPHHHDGKGGMPPPAAK